MTTSPIAFTKILMTTLLIAGPATTVSAETSFATEQMVANCESSGGRVSGGECYRDNGGSQSGSSTGGGVVEDLFGALVFGAILCGILGCFDQSQEN